MIKGKRVTLRLVRESDLDTLLALMNDLQNLGDYNRIRLISEVDFRKKFEEHGFWDENNGSLLIWVEDRIVGRVIFLVVSL